MLPCTAWAILALLAYQVAAQSSGLTCLVGQGPDLAEGSTPRPPAKLEPTTDESWKSCYIMRETRYENLYDPRSPKIFSDTYNGTWRTCAEWSAIWDQLADEALNRMVSCSSRVVDSWACAIKTWRSIIYCCDSNQCNYRGPPGTQPSLSPSATATRRPPGPQASQSPSSSSNFSLLTRPILAIPLLCALLAALLVLM